MIEKLCRLGTDPHFLFGEITRAKANNRADESFRTALTQCLLTFAPEEVPSEIRAALIERQRAILDDEVAILEKEPLEIANRLLEKWNGTNSSAPPQPQEPN